MWFFSSAVDYSRSNPSTADRVESNLVGLLTRQPFRLGHGAQKTKELKIEVYIMFFKKNLMARRITKKAIETGNLDLSAPLSS